MLKIAILTSKRAPGIEELLNDPRRGTLFDIVAVVTSEHDFAHRAPLSANGVPVMLNDIGEFYRAWNARRSDLDLRKTYDAMTVQRLALFEIDLVIMCSYLYIATDVLLKAFPNRIVNLHHSNLPGYKGLHAVRDAIMSGEMETYAVAHVVTPEVDEGPVIARSPAFPIHPMVQHLQRNNMTRALKAYAFAHQEWMIDRTWAPLMTEVIEHYAGIDTLAYAS